MIIKLSHAISLQASSKSVSMDGFVYCGICACMFAICTYVQTHVNMWNFHSFCKFSRDLSQQDLFWSQRVYIVSKAQNFCFEFQQSETDCKSDFGLQHKWGNLCFMKKPHLKYNSSTHTIFCGYVGTHVF